LLEQVHGVCVLGGGYFACGELRHVSSNPDASSVDGVGGSNLARSQKIGSICMCYAMRIHNPIACKENRRLVLFFLTRQYFVREVRKSSSPLASSTSGKFVFFVALTVLPNRNNRSDYSQCSKEKTKRATQTKTGASALPFFENSFSRKG
jgi:hypothetical protein